MLGTGTLFFSGTTGFSIAVLAVTTGRAVFSMVAETFSLDDLVAELLTNSRFATLKLFSTAVAGGMGACGFGLPVSICAFAVS
jgi:hypothetical protein